MRCDRVPERPLLRGRRNIPEVADRTADVRRVTSRAICDGSPPATRAGIRPRLPTRRGHLLGRTFHCPT